MSFSVLGDTLDSNQTSSFRVGKLILREDLFDHATLIMSLLKFFISQNLFGGVPKNEPLFIFTFVF